MPVKRALIVGMNDYPGERNDLPSCIDDAHAFTRILTTHYGFDAANIETYFNQDATLAKIRDRLVNWLLVGAGADDRLVFYYSGHGWRTERDGMLRECLCLYDDFLFDNELVRESQGLPAGILTIVLDSCHSGGMSKPFFVEQAGVELTENKVWRPDGPQQDDVAVAEKSMTPIKPFGQAPILLAKPPLEAAKTFQTQALYDDARFAHESDPELYPVPDSADAADASELELNGLLISACTAEQTAAASTSATTSPDGREQLSAFTFAMRRALDGLITAEGDVDRISARRVLDATAQELADLRFRQTPLLQETALSKGLGAYAFIDLRPVGDGVPAAPVGTPPATGTGSLPIWQSPEFQQLVEELARALANGASADAARSTTLTTRGRM
ncbi:MAG: caspase family protein [Chloroflexi bacterium]|nr:caspase family protein [Chloroflexota bacterium]